MRRSSGDQGRPDDAELLLTRSAVQKITADRCKEYMLAELRREKRGKQERNPAPYVDDRWMIAYILAYFPMVRRTSYFQNHAELIRVIHLESSDLLPAIKN
jgi:hypothetical protein